MSYHVFVRSWWKDNASWPNGLEPDGAASKFTLRIVKTESEARAACRDYNDTHNPGRYSRKAEYEQTALRGPKQLAKW
jgi:hypothetical protein